MRLTTGLDDRLARRLFAGRIGPGLLHALSRKGVFVGVLTFTMPLLTALEGGGSLEWWVPLGVTMWFIAPGRRSLTSLPANPRDESGGTAPGAFPNETSVPFLRSFKLLSNLDTKVSKPSTEWTPEEGTYVPFPTPANMASASTPFVTSNTHLTVSSFV